MSTATMIAPARKRLRKAESSIVVGYATGSTGKIYTLRATHIDGSVYCSCPAWRFMKMPANERRCKHMIAKGF